MKKIVTLFLSFSLLATVFSSCSSDDDKNEDFKNYPYSSLTPTQQKEKLGQDANSFITSMDGLSSAKSIALLNSLDALLEIAQPVFSATDGLRASTSIIYIKDFYGKYSWDAANKTWIKSVSADKLILEFPATKTSTANDGKIEVTGVSSGNNTGEYELPKELNALLYVGTTNVGSIQVKGTDINAATAPKAAEVKFTLDGYTLQMNAERGTKNVASFKLTNGSTVLLDGNVDLIANLEKVIDNGNISGSDAGAGNVEVNIMNNLVIYGTSDLGKIASELDAIEAKYDEIEYSNTKWRTYEEEKMASLNKNSALVLASKGEKAKIATIEMRVKDLGSEYESVPTLKFGDDTVVDADVYFSTGFNSVLNTWNNFINKF